MYTINATSAPAVAPTRNLLLVHQPGSQDRADFEAIAALVRTRAPDIEVLIASNGSPSSVTRRQAARRPTLVFTPLYLRYFMPDRGKVYAGQPMTKQQQFARFVAADLPVPPTWFREDAASPNPALLGEHVLVKPAVIGASLGTNIRLMRTSRAIAQLPDLGEVFLQKFIDTGPHATYHRVYTIFGRPVAAHTNTSTVARAPLDAADDTLASSTIQARRSSGQTKTLCHEDDVLKLAGLAWKAVPEVPFQACDIIRDRTSGALYLLEINPGGNTWIFSRENTPRVIEELGGIDIKKQFNAFETIADALIERTRLEAQ